MPNDNHTDQANPYCLNTSRLDHIKLDCPLLDSNNINDKKKGRNDTKRKKPYITWEENDNHHQAYQVVVERGQTRVQ